ncbi:alpha/beta hydrolase [Mucilaginibacter corticis]|uniref:Alpha/beta hydrolase n=1 Tax=Mucilaginibacter corticis TaxID=2597670 RepID=A0A556MKY5_9SPHI|nr:alpha/beta hydrolase-fold protein [Mucilaginibacter corticis]TSJ40570.1 alpha/beta hydrolase [Mucilaginibacter corticis]
MKLKWILSLIFLLVLGQGKVSAQKLVDTAQAKYETSKLVIERLKRQRTLQIYLPKGYSTSSKRYPVIYIQDGQDAYIKDALDGDKWYADSLVNLMAEERQCILVAVYAGSGSTRTNEYNPYLGNSDGAIYASYLAKVVKPYIDANYHTKDDAKYTAIVGSAAGGIIATYTTAKYSDVFGVAGIFSPAYKESPGIFDDMTKQAINSKSRFFLAYGDVEDNEAADVNRMSNILRHKKMSSKNTPTPLVIKSAKADQKQWRTDFEAFYNWFIDKL